MCIEYSLKSGKNYEGTSSSTGDSWVHQGVWFDKVQHGFRDLIGVIDTNAGVGVSVRVGVRNGKPVVIGGLLSLELPHECLLNIGQFEGTNCWSLDAVRGSTENCIKHVCPVITSVGWHVVALTHLWRRFCKRERDMLKIKVHIYLASVRWKVCKLLIHNLMLLASR